MGKIKKSKPSLLLKKIRSKKFPTATVFLLGVLLMSLSVLMHVHERWKLSFIVSASETSITKQNAGSPPTFIFIPRVNISLPVSQTVIANNLWEIAPDGVSHLKSSANPGTMSNSIFYAHDTNDRFGPLFWVEKGDEIRITTADGQLHVYTIEKTEIVSPTQTDILEPSTTEIVTLYTCYGFADLKRFVVTAKRHN